MNLYTMNLPTSYIPLLTVVYCQLGKLYDNSMFSGKIWNSTPEWHNCTQLHLLQLIAIHSCY